MTETRKLDAALESLVHDGSLGADQADLVRSRYLEIDPPTDSVSYTHLTLPTKA